MKWLLAVIAALVPLVGFGQGVNLRSDGATPGTNLTLYYSGIRGLNTNNTIGHSRAATNVVAYTNMARMLADSAATVGTVGEVYGYWGTNKWGQGKFDKVSAITGGTNLGTQFAAAGSGFWKRQVDSTNVFKLEWFGVYPITSAANVHSSRRELTNLLAQIGDGATVIFPRMRLAFDTAPGQTNAINLEGYATPTLLGDGDTLSPDYLQPDIEDVPTLSYIGVTNGTLLRIRNTYSPTIKGLGFWGSSPMPPYTNAARVMVDIDQSAGGAYITTQVKVENSKFVNPLAKPDATMIYISHTSLENCEGFQFENVAINAGYGVGIHQGDNANALLQSFRKITFVACSTNMVIENGSFDIDGVFGTSATVGFDLRSSEPSSIRNVRTELDTTPLLHRGGASTLTIEQNSFNASPQSTNAVIHFAGNSRVRLINNALLAASKPFSVESGFSVAMSESFGNTYTANLTNHFRSLGSGMSFSDNPFVTASGMLIWDGGVDLISSLARYNITNATYSLIGFKNGQNDDYSTVVSRNYGKLQVGHTFGGDDNDPNTFNLAVNSPTALSVQFGDAYSQSRFKFYAASPGYSILEVNGTNRSSIVAQSTVSGGYFQLDAQSANNILIYGANPFILQDGANRQFMQVNQFSGVEHFTSTNVITVKARHVQVTNTLGVLDDPYAAGWNGSTNVPTKNAVYDKIESLVTGGGETGMRTNQFTTNVVGQAIVGGVNLGSWLRVQGDQTNTSDLWIEGDNLNVMGDLRLRNNLTNVMVAMSTNDPSFVRLITVQPSQSIRLNSAGTAFEAFTPGSGGVDVAAGTDITIVTNGNLRTISAAGAAAVYWYTNGVDAITNTSGFAFLNNGTLQNRLGTWVLSPNSVSTLPDGVDFGVTGNNYIHDQSFALNDSGISGDSVADTITITNNLILTKGVTTPTLTTTGTEHLIASPDNLILYPTNGPVQIAAGQALTVTAVFFPSNAIPDVTLVDMTKAYAYTNHTANFTIAGFTSGSIYVGGTNFQWATRFYTNNSATPKTITLPTPWQDLGVKGNPVYNTNFGCLSVMVLPGQFTNYLWVGR